MISKRLTKTQKEEILQAYKNGDHTNALAKKYSCTPNTINRTVKTLLSDNEYTFLKEQRTRVSNKKVKLVEKEISENKLEEFEESNSLISHNYQVVASILTQTRCRLDPLYLARPAYPNLG